MSFAFGDIARVMKRKTLIWVLSLFALGASIWLGFKKEWSPSAWLGIGLVLFLLVSSWLFSFWQRKFARRMASLPADERRRRLAAMSPEQRQHVLQWMKSIGTESGSRGDLPPAPHTTGHAGPRPAVPGTPAA